MRKINAQSKAHKLKRNKEVSDDGAVCKKLRYTIESALELDSLPVAVVVGDDEIRSHVHESLLTSSSQFFKNALKNEWKEKTTRTITLPDHKPQVFKIYADWLYIGRLCTTDVQEQAIAQLNDDEETYDSELETYCECYALGNFIQDFNFRDNVIDAIIEKTVHENIIWISLPHYVYRESRIDSPHRKLALDLAVQTWPTDMFDTIAVENHPVEFLTDLLTKIGPILCNGREVQSPNEFYKGTNTCKYHEHTVNNTPCYKSKRGL